MSHKELSYDIISKFRSGDESAFTVIYNHFYNPVCSFCKYLLPTIEDARDMTAQLFILLWEKRQTMESHQQLRGFLFLNARNKCFNFLRNQKARSAIDQQLSEQAIFFAEIESELVTRLQEELEKLPDYYRNILKLSYYEGYNNQEIADMLNISEKTVRNAKSLALKTVKVVFRDSNAKIAITIFFLSQSGHSA